MSGTKLGFLVFDEKGYFHSPIKEMTKDEIRELYFSKRGEVNELTIYNGPEVDGFRLYGDIYLCRTCGAGQANTPTVKTKGHCCLIMKQMVRDSRLMAKQDYQRMIVRRAHEKKILKPVFDGIKSYYLYRRHFMVASGEFQGLILSENEVNSFVEDQLQ